MDSQNQPSEPKSSSPLLNFFLGLGLSIGIILLMLAVSVFGLTRLFANYTWGGYAVFALFAIGGTGLFVLAFRYGRRAKRQGMSAGLIVGAVLWGLLATGCFSLLVSFR